jgi:hypothetical protein
VVSLYGRSILESKSLPSGTQQAGAHRAVPLGRHFYTSNTVGLYPGYPGSDTELLILTESVIDSATLLSWTDRNTLALYGTNGFKAEHEAAVKNRSKLKEVVLFFDGDDVMLAA